MEPKLTDRKLLDVLHELNGVLEYRLRAKEVVPMQMASYRIGQSISADFIDRSRSFVY